jgi:RNA polymerase sigma factor (sigma-70 family)
VTQTGRLLRETGVMYTRNATAADDLGGLTDDGARALLGFTRALTGDRGLAEDIVQDIVLRLLTRTGPPIDNVDAYTRRMAVNAYISWRRKWHRVEPVGVVEDRGSHPDPTQRYIDLAELRQHLDRLSRKQRAVVVMRYLADQSDDEIAAILDCSENAVRSLASRALARLRIDLTATQRKDAVL